MTRFVEMARIVKRAHKRPRLVPAHQLPDTLVRVIGPLFGLSQSYIRNHLGIRFTLDKQRSIDELGLRYRPIDDVL